MARSAALAHRSRFGSLVARTSVLAAAVVALLPAAARALPGSGPHETVDVTASTTHVATPTALGYAATYRNPADPAADPPALRRLVITLPAGTRIDTTVPAVCSATDEQIRLLGDAACPAGSRVGSGEATADVLGIGRMTFATTLFNGPDQQIEVIESGNALGSNGAVRTYIHGTTLDGPVPTCLTGGSPPTGCPFDQVTLLANHLTADALTVGEGAQRRSYGTTPPTCPSSGAWETPVTLTYADGTVETVVTTQPCDRATAATAPPASTRRAPARARRHARRHVRRQSRRRHPRFTG